jgi:hypothetical protein
MGRGFYFSILTECALIFPNHAAFFEKIIVETNNLQQFKGKYFSKYFVCVAQS